MGLWGLRRRVNEEGRSGLWTLNEKEGGTWIAGKRGNYNLRENYTPGKIRVRVSGVISIKQLKTRM